MKHSYAITVLKLLTPVSVRQKHQTQLTGGHGIGDFGACLRVD